MSGESPGGQRRKVGGDDSHPKPKTLKELAQGVGDPEVVGGAIPEEAEVDVQAQLREAQLRAKIAEEKQEGKTVGVQIADTELTKSITDIIAESQGDGQKASDAIAAQVEAQITSGQELMEAAQSVFSEATVPKKYGSKAHNIDLDAMIKDAPKGAQSMLVPRMKDDTTPHLDEKSQKQIFDVIFFDKDTNQVTGYAMPHGEPPNSSIGPETQNKLNELCPGEGKMHMPKQQEVDRVMQAEKGPAYAVRNALENPPGGDPTAKQKGLEQPVQGKTGGRSGQGEIQR